MNDPIKAFDFLDRLQRYMALRRPHQDMTVQIVTTNPGTVGGTPCVPAVQFGPGIDWDNGKLLIYPQLPLTALSPKQLTDITKSARDGQSWHAYQAQKRLHERVRELEAEVAALKQGGV